MLRASETAAGTDHLWAKAAELERDFAGYKRRLAERKAQHAVAAAAEAAGRRAGEEEERAGDADGRGRRYEEYVRRRDERLRHEWRARMERKEAEVQALWARLDRTGSRGGGRRSCGGGGGGGGNDHDGGGELAAAAASHAREDQVNKPPQKPGNLAVKVKPSTPATPRGGNPGHPPPPPAAKLARPRTSVPPSLAAGGPSPRLSTPDPRRRPSHLHRAQPQPQPPATPRKENRLPPSATAALPATPRPRTTTTTMLSRSRSMFKDRGGSSAAAAVGESPRPPRFQPQPPRASYDGGASAASSNLTEPRADDAAMALVRSSSCSSSRKPAVVADRMKKASAVAPESPFLVRRPGDGSIEPAPPVVPKEIREITPAGCGNADIKINRQEHVDQSSDKFGSGEITGDSDTEPSYVYIKKDGDGQIPRRPPQASSAGVGTRPAPEPRPDNNEEDSDNAKDAMESTGSNEVAAGETPAGDAEEELRRESSESLYSNVPSSFSARSSEPDTSATGSPLLPSATEQPPESNASPWTTKKSTEVEEGAEKRPPTPTTPRSSLQSPMDAVNGLKRLLNFGKRIGKPSEAVAVAAERAPRSATPAPPPAAAAGDDGSVTGECPAKLTVDSSDDLDNSYIISPYVLSLQGIGPSYPAISELKEPVLHAKSPRVHRSFFSFSTFKSRAN